MPSFGQFSARITVNNNTLPEYRVELDESTTTMSCWIPSEEGQEFIVRWKDNNNKFDLSGHVRVDGVRAGSRSSKHRPRRRVLEANRQFVRTSANSGRPLLFSKVELTEDDRYLDNSISEELGEIQLVLWQTNIIGHLPVLAQGTPSKLSNAITLHERTKKAVGHCVSTGDETMYTRRRGTNAVKIRKLVTFIFKYRSLALLRAEGIAPLPERSLTATSGTSYPRITNTESRAVGDLASVERDRDAERERELLYFRNPGERGRVKAEIGNEPRPTGTVINHLGTIDLTLDD